MPRYIINLRDEKNNQDNFMEWSTIVDAPVTDGMTWKQFRRYYKMEYGKQGMEKLAERMNRVHEKGTSCYMDNSVQDTVECNRAGSYVDGYVPKEESEDYNSYSMTYEELLDEFCRPFYKDRI